MGHQASSLADKQGNKISKNKLQDPKIRRRLNPLQYVKPVDFRFQQPSVSSDIQIGENFLNINQQMQKQNFEDQLNKQNIQIQEEIANVASNEPQSKQIMYRKVQIKWNKFIKMKRKNFLYDYKLIKEIGRGGFGCVYKVAMKNGQIFRAAKKINKANLKSQQHQNLLAEMAIMMYMDHPNITKLYEVYDQPNYYVLILQLCDGGQLFQKLVDRNITQNDAKCIMRQILSALHYLHSKGIVHRDIKLQNMLFQQNTKLIKLIDFGISTKIQENSTLTSRVGTPYYIAPEVLAKKYNQKCDIWSLGVVLFMIIYNNPPFKGDSPVKVMQSIMKDEIHFRNPTPYKFSHKSLQFLKYLLQKNPNQRPTASEALSHKWLEEKEKLNEQRNTDEKDKVLQRIIKFHFKNKLEAVVYTYIVSQLLSSQQRIQLLQLFRSLDKNHNGIIQVNQLKNALNSKSFFQLNQEKIKLIIDYLDTNCSGAIDYTQFLVGALDFGTKIEQKHLEQAFRYFDIDNSGEITFQEVAKFLQNQIASQQQIRELFMQVDQNKDGVISKSQFVQLLAYKKMQMK